jgi:iron(III) transport system ATP-binding protein
VVEPGILLLDEPLSNLDANLREEMRFEIRRLHDEMRITSVYVTHDQAEAMVTSDRIAVLHDGRLEQIGTPEEIYEHPRTEFVASFIGRTNCLGGVVAGDGRVDCAGLALRVSPNGGPRTAGTAVAVSIRPQSIEIEGHDTPPPRARGGAGDVNVVVGRVLRSVYLGEARDYQVGVAGSEVVLRVATAAQRAFKIGETVRLVIEPGACRVIPAPGEESR